MSADEKQAAKVATAEVTDPSKELFPKDYRPQTATPIPHRDEESYAILTATYSGPLPTPDLFQGYEQTLPGSAHRIVQMAEINQAHDRRMDWANFALKVFGQFFAGGLCFVCLYFAYKLGMAGHDWLAYGLATISIGSILGAFILGRPKPPAPPAPQPSGKHKKKKK